MSDSLIDDLLSDWDEDEDGAKDEDVEANRPAPPSAKSSAPIEPVDDEDDAIDDGEALDDSLLDTADEPGDVDLTSMAIDLNKDDNEVNRIHMPPDEDDEDDDVHDEIEEWPEDEDDDEDDFDEDEETSSLNAGIDDSDDSEDENDLDDSDDDWGESDEEDSDEDLDDEEEDTPVGSRFRPRHDDFENEDDTVSKPNRKPHYENDFDENNSSEYDEDDSDEDEDASPEEEEDYEDDALPIPDLDEELQGMSMADDDSMAMDDYPEPSRPARPRRRRPRPIPDDDSYEDEDEEDSNKEPIPIPTSGKGRRPVGMNHKRLRRPKPLPEDMEESEPEKPDEDTPEGNNGGRGLLGKVPHVHMPKFRKPTASSIINAPFNLLRKIRKARRMYWIASMVAGLLIALWSALNIGAATNKGGPTTEAVNEGSVEVSSASWDKGKDQAEVMLRNKSDMIAHMAGKADVRTWSPDYRPASWVSPRVVASCPIPQQDIDPGKTKTITISMKDCKGKVHGVWPRVKVQLDYQ